MNLGGKARKIPQVAVYGALFLFVTASAGAFSISWGSWHNYWNGYYWQTGDYPTGYGYYSLYYPYYYTPHVYIDYTPPTYTTGPREGNTIVYTQNHANCADRPSCSSTRSYCGDGWCTLGESPQNCPVDCSPSPYCGDGVCSNGETTQSCPEDCKSTTHRYCGDGRCNNGETKYSCPEDCGLPPYCGDGVCNGAETKQSCPEDCGLAPYCGDGNCDKAESKYNCPEDCGLPPYCGDGVCNGAETPYSCSLDCGNPKCSDPVASEGDKICVSKQRFVCHSGSWEFKDTVQCCESIDCPSGYACRWNRCEPYNPQPPQPQYYCGDGRCNNGESCSSCPQDCGECSYCGDGVCDLSRENQHNCPQDCGMPFRHMINLQTEEECQEIVTGESGEFNVTVTNTGEGEEYLNVVLSGPLAQWASYEPHIILPPSSSRTERVEVNVPEGAFPGLYNATIRVYNQDAEARGVLRVDVRLPPEENITSSTGENATSGNTTISGATGGIIAGEITISDWGIALAVLLVAMVIFLLFLQNKRGVRQRLRAISEGVNTN